MNMSLLLLVLVSLLSSLCYVEGEGGMRSQGSFLPRVPSSRGSSSSRSILNMVSGGDVSSSLSTSPPLMDSVKVEAGYEVDGYNQTGVDIGSTPVASLLKLVDTNPESGLSSKEAERRMFIHGPNALLTPPGKSILRLILEQFDDRLVQILLVVAGLSGAFSYYEMLHSAATTTTTTTTTAPPGIIQSFVEPIIILSILVLNAIVGVWQSKSSSNSLSALKSLQPSLTTVLRDATWTADVDATLLVPGDIIALRVGDKVPTDARLLSLRTSVLDVDEGSLTGESATVTKIPGDDGLSVTGAPLQSMKGALFRGTVVTRGTGTALVLRTGMHTEMGKIQTGVANAAAEEIKTPLGIKLDQFGETLTKIIGGICLAVWLVSIPRFKDPGFGGGWLEGAIYYAKVAVALGVAAIPEGLPAVITLCLSLGTRRMAQRNVIVRKLPSVETLGCTSVICTDKTGTLTTNEMTVVSLVLLEKEGDMVVERVVTGSSYDPKGGVDGIVMGEEIRSVPFGSVADVAAVAALCNDAKIIGRDGTTDKDGKKKKRKKSGIVEMEKEYDRIGEPTEAALCILAEKLGGMTNLPPNKISGMPPSVLASANVNSWRSNFPRTATLEFDRDRKSMSVLCRPKPHAPNNPNRARPSSRPTSNRLFVKGAPNLLLKRCTHVKFRDGSIVKLSGDLRRRIERKTSDLAKRPLRCLALAVKETEHLDRSLKVYSGEDESGSGDIGSAARKHPLLSDPSKFADIESGLILVGIVGIKDPARPEVAESINDCTKAGIRVIMITGDAKDTAITIARDVNIFPPAPEENQDEQHDEPKAFEGREFFNKPEDEQLELLKTGNIVFCRAEPADKQKLIKMLQSLNEISAMTGDGVNDAPALQQADIGVAMGITGTEVSKEAADMILVDDNFSTIVNAIEEGRCIYANMQAFICFLISCNIGEICAILIATICGVPEPLTAMHLLWVNLVTDGPPATALGFNPPAPDLMKQPPRPSDEPIMTPWMITRYCITGLYVGIATVGIFVGHYLEMGLSLSQLSTWGKCGDRWQPPALSGGGVFSCKDMFTGDGRKLPQTLSLTTLVCIEMFKALSAVSIDSSLLSVGPHKNPYLVLGVIIPMLLHLAVVYSGDLGLPGLGDSFGVVPLSKENWISVMKWSVPILLVEEMLKAVGRAFSRSNQEKRAADMITNRSTTLEERLAEVTRASTSAAETFLSLKKKLEEENAELRRKLGAMALQNNDDEGQLQDRSKEDIDRLRKQTKSLTLRLDEVGDFFRQMEEKRIHLVNTIGGMESNLENGSATAENEA